MKFNVTEQISPVSQEYALIYYQYDAQKGNRDWNQLLESGGVKAVDLEIANTVIKMASKKRLSRGEAITRAVNVIYYGSPYSQSLASEAARIAYASSILREIL